MGQSIQRMDQVKFFKGCLPQDLLSPLLNTLSQMFLSLPEFTYKVHRVSVKNLRRCRLGN